MITPPYLKPGDSIAIVAPARKISLSEISESIEILQSWGLRIVFSKNLFESENQFAGTDKQRIEDFQEAINNPEIKAIFCARGGYGCVRIIDQIDFSPLLSSPKWIVGFSDITVFLSKLNMNGIEGLHAPVMTTLKDAPQETLNRIKNTLFGESLQYNIQLEEENPLNIGGECTGEIVGGNLSILYSLIGSNCDVDLRNKILFIEDLDEYLYHIDRMMMGLKRAGKLSELKALIVGDVSQMNDNIIPYGKTAEEIIRETVEGYNYPVCFNFPAGHISNNNPLIFGRTISLSIKKSDINIDFFTQSNEKTLDKPKKRILKIGLALAGFFIAIWLFYQIVERLIMRFSM
ncbi:LD-carboxypeptidase [Bacteroidales bacterium OttesenSCG-928-K03]|nr:LD-carboxypeptidase [Bacteroidales bacterium OttesenSCG-928-L14]MDL2240572.1 LD-carboxypeptidase [Bacteroidales bacterium OttesenSCG-928-K22]MDL2242646.1 LD-carboxypeptidase [Bacteroidales bacterium OttesenSCG-928-K03]